MFPCQVSNDGVPDAGVPQAIEDKIDVDKEISAV